MLLRLVAIAGFIYLVLPVVVVVIMSFSSSRYLVFPPPGFSIEWYQKFLQDPVWIRSTLNSFALGCSVAALAGAIGTLAAYGLVRGHPPARKTIAAFLLSPIIIPVIVSAISLYGFFVTIGIAGGFLGMLAAHTVLATPFVTIAVVASLQRLDPSIERAAASLGAGPTRVFLTITLPNIIPGVVSGALFAFITSFDELVLAMFVGGQTVTLPRKIWEDLVVLVEPTQAAASVILIVISILVLSIWAVTQRQDLVQRP
jgi:putative spermidine/putrescine transport system permease protein